MATVTLISQPNYWSPCEGEYSNLWYTMNSGSSGTTDFKYVVDLKSYNEVTTVTTALGRYKVPPRPTTGYGYFDASRSVQTQTSYDLYPNTVGFAARGNSIRKITMNYGYEYNPNLAWASISNSSGFVKLTFSASHGLSANDFVILNKDDKTINPQYDGTASITSVPTSSTLVINKTFGILDPVPETGTIVSTLRMTGTATDIYAFNGSRQYEQAQYDFAGYTSSVVGAPFLTNYPWSNNNDSPPMYIIGSQSKKIFSTDHEVLSFLVDNPSNNVVKMWLFELDANPYLGVYTPPFASRQYAYPLGNGYHRIDMGVGPANLAAIGLTLSVNTKFYLITTGAYDIGSPQTLNRAFYQVVDNCSPWKNIRLAFLNKLGGFDYMNFNWKSKNTFNTSKTEFKRQLTAGGYTVGERENTVLTSNSYDMWEVSTDWVSETEYWWLKELLGSSEVYVVKSDGSYLPIIITDTSKDTKTQLGDKLFCWTVNYKYAYKVGSQGN
jgi:hypothetical protein